MRHIPFRMAMDGRISGTRRHSKADGLLKDHDERGGATPPLSDTHWPAVYMPGAPIFHYDLTIPLQEHSIRLTYYLTCFLGMYFLDRVFFAVITTSGCVLATALTIHVQCLGNIYFKV